MVKQSNRTELTAGVAAEADAALKVAVLYQDSVTRHWAQSLWNRVGGLIGSGGICRRSWKLSDLARPDVLADAVRAAAEADILVVSLRDAESLPLSLYLWIDSWLPRRGGLPGALVALIGVPPYPDAPCGRTHQFLENVARKAGMDFLPREHKLREESFFLSNGATGRRTAQGAAALNAPILNRGSEPRLHWTLNE